MAVTGVVATKAPVANLVPGVHFFPYSHCGTARWAWSGHLRDQLRRVLERALRDPNGGILRPAAVLVELVQGEGGVVPADRDFVRRLRTLTRELDVPLVVDEVQTGCGRTGTWFAFEQYGIEPDVIVASKALSGIGQPVSIIVYDERLDVWAPGAHTGTFRGNQVAFAAGARAVEIVRRDDVLDNVRARAEQIGRRLERLRTHPWVRDVRGRGLMWGIELADPVTGAWAGELAGRVQARALRDGLIVELGGRDDCVVRLLPPLNVTADVVDTACDILLEALRRETECVGVRGPVRLVSGLRARHSAQRRIVSAALQPGASADAAASRPARRTPGSWSTPRTPAPWSAARRAPRAPVRAAMRRWVRRSAAGCASTLPESGSPTPRSTPARTSSPGTCWCAAPHRADRVALLFDDPVQTYVGDARRAQGGRRLRAARPRRSRPTASPTSSSDAAVAAVLSVSHLRA